MTQSYTVDVAILGAGTAGLSARRAAQAEGASVLMIDPGPFGTTCARVGCMPSKLLIAAAEHAHEAHRGAPFGVHVDGVRIDGPAVMRRVQSERDRFVGFVVDAIDEAKRDGELLVGRATVTGENTLEVALNDGGTAQVAFRSLVIGTGTAPFVPPPFRGIDEQVMLTNEGIFELEDLPESLLVVGLGVIGLELGQAFHRLGTRTTLIGVGGQIGPISDPDVLKVAESVFRDELDLHPDYVLQSIEPEGDGVRLKFTDSQGRARDEHFARVLMAAGRRTSLPKLGLQAAGVEPDGRGRYPIDPDTLQLADKPYFVAGDANELHPLLHEAADDGKIAGKNAAIFPALRAPRRRTPIAVVFSDPQIGIVGQGYRALENCVAVAGEVSYADQGRARVHGINKGHVRIYADKNSGCLLGAELFGPRVEHMSHLLAWAVQQGLTVSEALEMPFYHPVVEEGLRTALRDLNVALRRGAPIKCPVSELGVGA